METGVSFETSVTTILYGDAFRKMGIFISAIFLTVDLKFSDIIFIGDKMRISVAEIAMKNAGDGECSASTCYPAGFLLGLFFYPEDGGDMFLRNVG
jgi:hypothetical protein